MNRPNRTGEVAKEMKLMQPDSTYLSMYSLKSDYTMLYFYSTLCSHCQEKLPIAYAAYQKYKDKGLKCYAVNTDQEVTYWKNYVREKHLDWYNVIDPNRAGTWDKDYTAYNLPVIYLLDKDKRILMKRIVPEQLDNVLKLIFSK
jgi:thiol-disulfide isomerase/thioredoxin